MIFRGKYQVLGLVAVMAIFCSVDAVMAQPGRGRGGSPFGQTSGLNLLGQEGIQQELELVDDQVESLKELQDEQRNAMREMFMGLRDQIQDMDEDERRELMTELQGKMKEMNKEFDTKADEVLLPHQTTRLKQLVAQNLNRRNGGAGSGSFSPEMIETLDISDEQLEKMKAKAEELQTTVAEKIAKIRKQAEEEILSILSAEQQAQYKEMIGDSYDFNQGGGGRGGFGGGQGGNQGGNRGGRGQGGDRGGRGQGGDQGGGRGGRQGADNAQRGDDF